MVLGLKVSKKFNLMSNYGVEEKAEYKKNFVPYLLGAVLLFTGTLIPQLIYEIIRDF